MKKLMMAVWSLLVITAANAQDLTKGRHNGKKQHRKEMVRQLGLTEGQQQQAKAIRETQRKQIAELNKNESITVKEFRDRKAALRQSYKTQMAAILTPSQKEKLAQQKAAHRAKKEANFTNRLEKMRTGAGLTDEQVAKIKSDRATFTARRQSLKENQTLNRAQRREAMQALKQERKTQMEALLTPDQKEKLKGLKKKHAARTMAK